MTPPLVLEPQMVGQLVDVPKFSFQDCMVVEQLVDVPSIVPESSLLRTVEQIADIPVPVQGPSSSSAILLDAPNGPGDWVFRTSPKILKVQTHRENHAESMRWRMLLNSRVRLQRCMLAGTPTVWWERTCGAACMTRYMACTAGNWAPTLPSGHRLDQGHCPLARATGAWTVCGMACFLSSFSR